VGVLVTGNTYRFPALLAKEAATVDHASNGRLILGIGAGWYEQEHKAYGIPFYTVGQRARRLGETVDILKALFTQPRTTYKGKYYTITDAPFEPKGVQQPHPPILIGGMGPKLVQPVAARHAQMWHFFVRDGDVEKAKELCAGFDKICREVGRDPAEVEKVTSLRVADLAKSAKEVRARIDALAEVGVRHFILQVSPPFDREVLRRFAKEVMAEVRSGS
jgi:alkanesulfonate monooxygenase SsuD/methylene tetrahydromethanopterin reductase-like flavin-dependent oxidoreductase (luciferase family)